MPRRRAVQMPPPGANHPSRALDEGEALARAMEIEGRRATALALSDLQTPGMPEVLEIVEPGPSKYAYIGAGGNCQIRNTRPG